MPIIFDEKNKVFNLQTKNTSYVMGVFHEKHLLHLYYGKKIAAYGSVEENIPTQKNTAFYAQDIKGTDYNTGTLPMEYPTYGSADMRTPAFHAEYENGSAITCLSYSGHEIFKGKKALSGLPATYVESESEADTLEITLTDAVTGLSIILSYSVFADYDAIAKSVCVVNGGNEKINVKSVLSSSTYLFDKDYDFVHLQGHWARERQLEKRPLMHGIMSIDSKRVSSSHLHSPFLAMARPTATETTGEVYGYSLVYSGNFVAQAEVNPFDVARINMGINPFGFSWLLEAGESFQAPEVVLTYSDSGFGQMSRNFHDLYRNRLCRGNFRDAERPVLINNWEATYFDFNEEKIVKIAEKAQSVGVELMVLDDGWFGKRNSDNCSLGDWYADPQKLPAGIPSLAQKIKTLGMKFGLWFEPEMISEDSDLYRAHPDWCIHVNGRERTPGRWQLVLDLSREDVRDYVVKAICDVLASAPISYVKWDMNRNITEIGSDLLPAERQQELPHRYILGVYDILERITSAFPDVLFEGCSGGGGRFDAGMLYYFPQYWTSDDTDAVERMYIQHSTSLIFPASTMGAHVSAVPNHQVHRTTPLATRGNVAMVGQFGYELDLNTLSDEEITMVKEQIQKYKKIRSTVHYGDMYRLKSPYEGNHVAWEYVAKDKKRVVLLYAVTMAKVSTGLVGVKFEGLEPDATYVDTESGKEYPGDYLMNVGLYFSKDKDYESQLLVFDKK